MSNDRLELRQMKVGPWPMNAYALVCPVTKRSVLIDPGADPELLVEMLGRSTPIAILVTHSHMDHTMALDEIREQLDVPVVTYQDFDSSGISKPADKFLSDGDIFEVGEFRLRIFYAPGHINDQICFALEGDDRVIVGDTIFEGGPGKTWSSEGFHTTMETLRNVVLPWPDDTVCYPGHGPWFRLGRKRPAIEAFLAKDHGDFYGDATWDM